MKMSKKALKLLEAKSTNPLKNRGPETQDLRPLAPAPSSKTQS
jgi:hypothetical protein